MKGGVALIGTLTALVIPSYAQAIDMPWDPNTHAKYTNQQALSICKNDSARPKGYLCKRPTDIRTRRTCDPLKRGHVKVGLLRLWYWYTNCDLRYVEVHPTKPSVHVAVFGCRYRVTVGFPKGAIGRCNGGRIAPFGFIDWRGEGYIGD